MRVQAWATELLLGVFKGRPLEELHEYEVEVALQDACGRAAAAGAGEDGALPPAECLTVVVDRAKVLEGRAKGMAARISLDARAGARGPRH